MFERNLHTKLFKNDIKLLFTIILKMHCLNLFNKTEINTIRKGIQIIQHFLTRYSYDVERLWHDCRLSSVACNECRLLRLNDAK